MEGGSSTVQRLEIRRDIPQLTITDSGITPGAQSLSDLEEPAESKRSRTDFSKVSWLLLGLVLALNLCLHKPGLLLYLNLDLVSPLVANDREFVGCCAAGLSSIRVFLPLYFWLYPDTHLSFPPRVLGVCISHAGDCRIFPSKYMLLLIASPLFLFVLLL